MLRTGMAHQADPRVINPNLDGEHRKIGTMKEEVFAPIAVIIAVLLAVLAILRFFFC